MNQKIIKKIISILTILGICMSLSTYPAYAAGGAVGGGEAGGGGDGSTTYSVINPDTYKPNTSSVENGDKLKNIGNDIIGFLQLIGTILSVLVLAVIGIKYMIGSVEERAEYKKAMLPYVIGAIMVFAITNLLGIIASLSGSLL